MCFSVFIFQSCLKERKMTKKQRVCFTKKALIQSFFFIFFFKFLHQLPTVTKMISSDIFFIDIHLNVHLRLWRFLSVKCFMSFQTLITLAGKYVWESHLKKKKKISLYCSWYRNDHFSFNIPELTGYCHAYHEVQYISSCFLLLCLHQ